ncbi:MAG TPA: PhnA domain-containing protein [Ferruginibacter sp.]|jgi:protein PhnA|nr:PhnA domain-containing protein [Ferruginibacter sp.]
MSINTVLQNRSSGACELCSEPDASLLAYAVPPKNDDSIDNLVVLCSNCYGQIAASNFSDSNYWRFLTGSIWNEVPAVQALSYKILTKLSAEEWASETIGSVSLEESVINWANAEDNLEAARIIHKDAFGAVLATGDSVVLTQNLNVKGTSFTAPKGTIVRKIKLVDDNAEQVEGKIEGEMIVILTKYVRKSTV